MKTKIHILHIGYPKSGSTAVQRYLFSNLISEEAIFVHRPFENILVYALSNYETHRWDKERFCNDMMILLNKFPNKKIILSSEILTGGHQLHNCGFKLIKIILAVFTVERIMLIIRNPYGYIYSSWVHQVREGGLYNLSSYLRAFSRPTKSLHQTILQKVDYIRYVEKLESISTNEKLFVVPFDKKNYLIKFKIAEY